jgi:hypothetical protein
MALLHLGCPACGGALCLAEGERITACRYCGGRCLVLAPDAVPRYTVEGSVGREAAVRIALQSLQRPDVPATVRGRTGVDAAGLCYVPFFEATAVRLGSVFIRERVKPPAPLAEGEQGGQALDRWLADPGKEREDTKVVEQDVLRIAPACELPELGVDKIRLADLRRAGSPVPLSSFDGVSLQSRAVVFAPTTSAERFLVETTWRVASVNDDTRYVDTRVKLLYYPVWRMRYRHRGRVYELAVDGVQGRLLRGTAPQCRGRRRGRRRGPGPGDAGPGPLAALDGGSRRRRTGVSARRPRRWVVALDRPALGCVGERDRAGLPVTVRGRVIQLLSC